MATARVARAPARAQRAVSRAFASPALADATVPGLLLLLVAASAVLRTRALDAGFWIDEALSVGIAAHPLDEIPGLLRQDGSPPLYYVLLHGWMAVFGRSEEATHALSLVFALATIPAAYWAASSLFGRRAGWICAVLAAINPFVTAYAQETRMYTLVALLSVLATGCFLHAFVLGRRRYVAAFALLFVLLLYAHNWSLFFAAGVAAAGAVAWRASPDRRRVLLDAVAVSSVAALCFAPWIPSLAFQAAHTGAPWSTTPSVTGLLQAPAVVLSGSGAVVALLLGAGTGLATILRRDATAERLLVVATIVVAAVTIVAGWAASQFAPAWSNRYLAVIVGPVLLLGATGLARAGRIGVVALALVVVLWASDTASPRKSNVRDVAAGVARVVERGDLVVSTQPEQTAVVRYYLGDGLRYATPLGETRDPSVMDWRDALERLERATPERTLEPLLDRQRAGDRVVIVSPVFHEEDDWEAPWTSLVRERSREWARALGTDPRYVRDVSLAPSDENARRFFKPVRGDVYVRRRAG